MNIPLTMMNYSPERSASYLHPDHIKPMYQNGVNELKTVVHVGCTFLLPANRHQKAVYRWFGSERYLYRAVAALGNQCAYEGHEQFEEYVMRLPDYTDKAPKWASNRSVNSRQRVELALWDDMDRLNQRWARQRRAGLVPDYSDYSEPEILTALKMEGMVVTGAEYSPKVFTTGNVNWLIENYALYERLTSTTFFQRNRYRERVGSRYREQETKPCVQRVASWRAISEELANRTDRIRHQNRINWDARLVEEC